MHISSTMRHDRIHVLHAAKRPVVTRGCFGVPVIDKSLGAAHSSSSHDDTYSTLRKVFHKSTRSSQWSNGHLLNFTKP